MRLGVDNGNGCTCDNCGTALLPKEAIKIKALKYENKTPLEPSKGLYRTRGICDLCKDCYKELFTGLLRPSDRAKGGNL